MLSRREYRYVGSKSLLELLERPSQRVLVESEETVRKWIHETQKIPKGQNWITATFIVDTKVQLYINDQRSEHVVCAAGGNVLSAGEMTFILSRNQIEVSEVTNQSTGYVPEPESWWAVEKALDQIGLKHPPDFMPAYLFRWCTQCGTINLVKDEWFECGVCQSPLSLEWNFDDFRYA
jgi:hypothetical protein